METFKHTIDNEEFKLNTIIDTDIITFKFYDKHYYNTYLLELNEEFINDMFSITKDNFKKVVIHCLLNNKKLNYIYKNSQIVILFEFNEIIELKFNVSLNKVHMESLENSKIAIKEVENKINTISNEVDIIKNSYKCVPVGMIKFNNNSYERIIDYVLYYNKINFSIKLVNIINLSPLYDYDNNIFIFTNTTYNKNLKTIPCEKLIIEIYDNCFIDNIPLSIKIIELSNQNIYANFISNIDKFMVLNNFKILILNNVSNNDLNKNSLLLNLNIKELHLKKNCNFSNYSCLDGKIKIKIID
jgi:hypothetical protein